MLIKDIKSDLIRGWALENCDRNKGLEDDLDDAFTWCKTSQGDWFWYYVDKGCEETKLRSIHPHLFIKDPDMSFLGSSQNSPEETEMLKVTTYKQDLKEFTKSALQGLLANPDLTHIPPVDVGHKAIIYAEAALAELERRNEQR